MGLVFGIVFVLVGLGFKISAVPFHMWTPDVYQGSPTSVTSFFSVVLLLRCPSPIECEKGQWNNYRSQYNMGYENKIIYCFMIT